MWHYPSANHSHTFLSFAQRLKRGHRRQQQRFTGRYIGGHIAHRVSPWVERSYIVDEEDDGEGEEDTGEDAQDQEESGQHTSNAFEGVLNATVKRIENH